MHKHACNEHKTPRLQDTNNYSTTWLYYNENPVKQLCYKDSIIKET